MKQESAPRIQLEPLSAAHAEELFVALSDPAIYTYLPDQPPVSVTALTERYRRLESRASPDGAQQWLNWAIRHREDHQCIGYVQATVHPEGTADFGFVLAPQFWGLGLAFEAATAALSRVFAEFEVAAIFATVDRHNFRSSALLGRLGFQRVSPAAYPHGTAEDTDDVFRLRRQEKLPRGLKIEYLADHPEFVSTLAAWHRREWGQFRPAESVAIRAAKLRAWSGRGQIPTALVASAEGALLGSAMLLAQDMETHPEWSPWLAGVVVAPEHRRRGLGAALAERAVAEARALDFPALYLYTFHTEQYYARQGWRIMERTTYLGGDVTVMSFDLR